MTQTCPKFKSGDIATLIGGLSEMFGTKLIK